LVQSGDQTERQLLELNYPIHHSTREANPAMVETLIADLPSRGAGQVRYKGHLGAVAHLVMSIMAHNSTVAERICQRYLSKRAEKSRQLLGLRHGTINEINNPKNQWLLLDPQGFSG
jgi:hypothetical protein